MPQKPSARPRENTNKSGGATRVKVGSEGNSKASTPRRNSVGRSFAGTLETVRHEIALRQCAAEASADASVAAEVKVEVKAVTTEKQVEHQALLDRGRDEGPGVDSPGASLGQKDDAPDGGDGSNPSPESAEDDAVAVAQDDDDGSGGGRDVGDGDGGEVSGAEVEVGNGGGLMSGAAAAAARRNAAEAAVELALASAEILPEVAAETAQTAVAALGESLLPSQALELTPSYW